ncbi:unnamed protein product [Euphydryas editha]|uniref:Gustatory receptor n=1 Tax=Euphydryas editha TaxID=104508 RepID=A0AAU9TPR3_EUPED|nr:unnamed protein product [Euphydryas editha]
MSKHDAFSTVEPLNYALRISSLSCIYRDGTKLKYSGPIWKFLLYIVVFIAASSYNIYLKSQIIQSQKKITFSDSIQVSFLTSTILYIIDIVYVYKYGRESFIDYFNLFDTIDSVLSKPSHYKVKKSIRNMCLFYAFIYISSITIELYTWTYKLNWIVLNVYFVEMLYLLIKMLAALDLIANLIQVKYRLEVIGDLLEHKYCQDDNYSRMIKDVPYERVWISPEIRNSNRNYSSKAASVTYHDILCHLSKCYMLLIDQSEFINLKYGIRLLVTCSIYLLDMVVLLNVIIRILMGNLYHPRSDKTKGGDLADIQFGFRSGVDTRESVSAGQFLMQNFRDI